MEALKLVIFLLWTTLVDIVVSDKVVTWNELETKTGKEGGLMWLSILGEVYDVTPGREHYEPGTGYHSFLGNDSSVPYCTGIFTAEEAEKSPNILEKKDLKSLLSWVQFYRDSDIYDLQGHLIDPRYYDEQGEPTEQMLVLQAKLQEIEQEMAEKKLEREKTRAEREKRKAERAARAAKARSRKREL